MHVWESVKNQKNHSHQWKFILVEIFSRNICSAMSESNSFFFLNHCICEKEGEESRLDQVSVPDLANN